MPLGQEDLLLGRIALHYKLVTQDQLTAAAARQDDDRGTRRLGEILLELGSLTPGQLDKLLAIQRDYLAKQQAQAAAPMEQPVPPLVIADPPAEVTPPPPEPPPPPRPRPARARARGRRA